MPRGWVVLVALGCSSTVLGQSPPPAEEIIDANGPGGQHGDSHKVTLPPEGPGRDAFLKEFITVDPAGNSVQAGGRALSAFDFYKRIDRPDLAARADERTRQKIWLYAGSALVLAAGVTGGAIEFATAQNPNDPSCAVDPATYNACIDAHNTNRNIGIALIAGSVAISAGLLTWGVLIPEMVTPSQETVTLATAYNRGLSKKYGAPGAAFRLLPAIAPGYTGLVARLTF